MFDWNAELEVAKRQVADLEDKVNRLREEMRRCTEDPVPATPIERILERNERILSVRMASLARAKLHARFLEQKIASGAGDSKPLPYVELAEVCFKAARWMPQGAAAEAVRRSGAAFYTKAVVQQKAAVTDATAKAIFEDMAATWTQPRPPAETNEAAEQNPGTQPS
jgi:hypothetical protein